MKHSEAFEALVNEVKPRIKETTCEKVKARLENNSGAYVVDVREDHEWQNGHVREAMHLGRGIIERDIEKMITDKESEIVLYCGGGYRSALAADNVQKMGYKNVFSMAGGIRRWRELGFPEDRP